MAIYDYTLDQLIERTCQLALGSGVWFEGTATGGTTGTVVDSSRYEADDYFQNIDAWAYIRTTTDGAAPRGEEREISDWVQNGGTATVLPVFSAAPAAGDTYAFIAGYRWAEIKAAINTAIDLVAPYALIEKMDETISLIADVYEYPLPAGFLYVYRIAMANSDGIYIDKIPAEYYRVVRSAPIPRLHFYRFPAEQQHSRHYYGELWANADLTADRLLRIEGLGRQATLIQDSDSCKINPDFVCYQAAALLHANRIRRSDTDPEEHRVQYQVCQGIADRISGGAPYFKNLTSALPPDSKRVEV